MPRIIIRREKVKSITSEVLRKLFEEHHRATLELFRDEVEEEIKKEYGVIIHGIEYCFHLQKNLIDLWMKSSQKSRMKRRKKHGKSYWTS